MNDTQRIWNVDVLSIPIEEIVERIDAGAELDGKPRVLACANPHSLAVAGNDPVFLEALRKSDYLIPDGFGIVVASKLLGGRIRRQITGPDVFLALSHRWNRKKGKRYFFLGSSEEVLEKIRTKMTELFPNIRVSGTFSPPFREFSEDDNERMIGMINESKPTALWVGMTAPKQEKWIGRHRDRLDVPFIGAVGALFDFFAGTKKLPRPWVRRMGLIWLYRLSREPKRLWRRNLISAPVFLYNVVLQKMGVDVRREKA